MKLLAYTSLGGFSVLTCQTRHLVPTFYSGLDDTRCLLRRSSTGGQLTIKSLSYSYENVLPSLDHAVRLIRIYIDLTFC